MGQTIRKVERMVKFLVVAALVSVLAGCATSTPAQPEENNSFCLRVGPGGENEVVASITDSGVPIAIIMHGSHVLALGRWVLVGPTKDKNKVMVEWKYDDGTTHTHIYSLANAYPCHF